MQKFQHIFLVSNLFSVSGGAAWISVPHVGVHETHWSKGSSAPTVPRSDALLLGLDPATDWCGVARRWRHC